MSLSPIENEFDRRALVTDAEETLRIIAALPAPEGIEDRVKAGLRSAPSRARIMVWPSSSIEGRWMQSAGIRVAAAAAIVMVIAGGGWGVYSHIQPAALPSAVSAPQPLGGAGFNAAGAKRVPQTLEGPVVATPVITKEKQESEGGAVHPQKQSKRLTVKKSAQQALTAR